MIHYDYHGSNFFKETGTYMHIRSEGYPVLHDHNYWECLILLSGSAQHTTEKETEILSEGSARLMHPKDMHMITTNNGYAYSELNFSVTEELFRKITALYGPDFYDIILAHNGCIKMQLSTDELKNIRHKLHLFQTLDSSDKNTQSMLIKMLFTVVLEKIYFQMLYSGNEYPEWLENFLNEIKKVQNMSASVSDIYKMSNFSHSQLTRLFKKYMGKTLICYLKELRLSYAAMLLQTTDYTVLNISNATGYTSLSHFNRIFKEHYGIVPSEFRNNYLHIQHKGEEK